jgi:hypothetical protein
MLKLRRQLIFRVKGVFNVYNLLMELINLADDFSIIQNSLVENNTYK